METLLLDKTATEEGEIQQRAGLKGHRSSWAGGWPGEEGSSPELLDFW